MVGWVEEGMGWGVAEAEAAGEVGILLRGETVRGSEPMRRVGCRRGGWGHEGRHEIGGRGEVVQIEVVQVRPFWD